MQDPEPKVEQKLDVDIDLRVQGVAQDAILQDEAKIREINQQVNKVKAGPNKISIRNDLAKDGMTFSETSETSQCPSCSKYVFEGTTSCECGKLLRPNKCTMGRIREAFEAFERKDMRS